MVIDQICAPVLDLLLEAETAAVGFGRIRGAVCPSGCGDCCVRGHPEDTVLSVLPAAVWAVDTLPLDGLLRSLAEKSGGPCVFYDPADGRHCSVYPLRPLVCRLFGLAGRHDKYGGIQYKPCRRMISGPPSADVVPPLFSAYTSRLEAVYPPLGRLLFPLHTSFDRAVQWILQRRMYEGEELTLNPARVQSLRSCLR